ncbi:MAG: sugar-binding domain-containing protein [Bacteroidota bacterium]
MSFLPQTPHFILTILLVIGMAASGMTQNPQRLSLDGQWEIIFDENNLGREAGWMKTETFEQHPDRQLVTVPSAWERLKEDYEGVAFYRTSFDLPADWEGKVIRLQFGAVNYLSEVWVNDEVVGFHEGGFTPFEFRIDEMVKAGETNELTLRVVGPLFLTDKEIDGMKALETPQWRGGISGGIWQSVQLLATAETYVDDVFIQPNIRENTASFDIELNHTAIANSTIDLEITITEASDSSTVVANFQTKWPLHPGQNQNSWTQSLPNAVYWSPDNPHLYLAKIQLRKDGQILDTWSHRFGMRELTITNKDFYLNGKRIYIKASFFEGLYPNGIAHPDNEEMIEKEIRLAKEAGFNLIRPWRRPPVPRWLDYADEMGVLVVGSPALECMQLPFSTPYLPMRVENEVRNAILRDRNRACVIQWELFNELHRPVLKQMMRPMAMLARDLDPTRLILDESGGWAFGANMYLPEQHEPTKFNDIHNYPGPFISESRYDGFLSIGMTKEEKQAAGLKGRTPGRNVLPGLMSYVSELGYGSLPDLTVNNERFVREGNALTPAYRYHERIARQQKGVLEESGFSYLYPDMQQFYLDQQFIHGTANKRMIEAVRANPEVDGYCIHALVAGDWILGAGLMDLWRNPKTYAYQGTKAANQPRILSVRAKPRNVYAEKGTTLEILAVNELEATHGNLRIEVVSAKGKIVYRKTLKKEWGEGVSMLLSEQLNTTKWRGNYTVKSTMLGKGGEILAQNSTPIDVFRAKDLSLPKGKIAVLDGKGTLTTALTEAGIPFNRFNAQTAPNTPVFVAGVGLDSETTGPLLKFIREGGTAVYIDGSTANIPEENSLFPFKARAHPGMGLWTCIPHLLRKHPIFQGLPQDQMMQSQGPYENIWATHTLRDISGEGELQVEAIVGVIGFDWFSREHKMHYSGPGASWWGADVANISLGEGRCIVSQLRIVENLGKDPVADKILRNMIRFSQK